MGHYLTSLAGGVLIGLSAAALLLGHGRIAGISGIVGGALRLDRSDLAWRLLFLGGLIGGGLLCALVAPAAFASPRLPSAAILVAGGLLVGFGTRLGNGCTSGHGVCGMGRLSTRSIVATFTFIATGAVTTYVMRHVIGGGAS